MKVYKKIFLLFIITNILFISFFPKIVLSDSDINYTFNSDTLLNYPIDSLIGKRNWNIRTPTEYTNDYLGTYSFTDLAIGTSGVNIDFIDIDQNAVDCTSIILGVIEGHKKVLELSDDNVNNNVDIINNFVSGQTLGTIEFWIRIIDATKQALFTVDESGVNGIVFAIDIDKFRYHDGSWQDVGLVALDNTWYHVGLVFDCTSDTYEIWINGIQYQTTAGFSNVLVALDRIQINSDNDDSGYDFYLDAIGYSWDTSYTIGDNLQDTTIYLDVLDFETHIHSNHFVFESEGVLNPDGADDVCGWIDMEGGGYDFTNVEVLDIYQTIRYLQMIAVRPYKTFNIQNGIIDIGWNMKYRVINHIGSTFTVNITSYDGTLIASIRILDDDGDDDFVLSYYNGTDYVELLNDLDVSISTEHSFNLNINSANNLVVLEDSVAPTFAFPMLANKEGLSKVEVYSNVPSYTIPAEYQEIRLSYIYVYVNRLSYSGNDYAFTWFGGSDVGLNNWYHERQNFFQITGIGNVSIYTTPYSYDYLLVEGGSMNLRTIKNMTEYNNITQITNLNKKPDYTWQTFNPFYFLFFTNNSFSISELKIDGVNVNDGVNTYYPSYEYNNINHNQAYFYVSSNRLHYTLNIIQDNVLEYIKLKIDNDNFLTVNKSISVINSFNKIGLPNLTLNYQWGYGNFIIFDSTYSNVNVILPQDKSIYSLSLYITDNNTNLFTDFDSIGYLTNLKFVIYADIQITILTLTLIGMLIPLIIIIVPTLAFSERFGKNVIIPLFLLMSLICVITFLIPTWLFFIIAISCSLFILKGKIESD